MCHNAFASAPYLNFSDIISGPPTGVNDGLGSGAIVTIWGNNLGSTRGTGKVYFKDSSSKVIEAAHIYYWKDADGHLPGGPADLFSYHKMQEICFSIPDSALGPGTIYITTNGKTSNMLPFTVRAGNIYHIKISGNDISGDGSWSSPWRTLNDVLSGNGKIKAGDLVYTSDVGSASDVNVGYVKALIGTSANPFSIIVYPNSRASMTGGIAANFRNWNMSNYYWNFSKFNLNTAYQGFSIFKGSRIVGNNVTGPSINKGYSGWVGGGCAGTAPDHCGGHNIYGNEVHHYGKDDGTVDQFQHLFYISNRSGSITEGYKIGWNYLHDNPIYQGIHVYDQEACGGWSGSIDIHHNVIKNQGGNSINVNFNCTMGNSTIINIYNNLTITDVNYNLPNLSAPTSALRIDASPDTKINVINNTFLGWSSINSIGTGIISMISNSFIGNRNVGFISGIPKSYDDNHFFNSVASVVEPAWAEITENPMLDVTYTPESNSPLNYTGNNEILNYSSTDLVGTTYSIGGIGIGALKNSSYIYIKSIKLN